MIFITTLLIAVLVTLVAFKILTYVSPNPTWAGPVPAGDPNLPDADTTGPSLAQQLAVARRYDDRYRCLYYANRIVGPLAAAGLLLTVATPLSLVMVTLLMLAAAFEGAFRPIEKIRRWATTALGLEIAIARRSGNLPDELFAVLQEKLLKGELKGLRTLEDAVKYVQRFLRRPS